MTKRLRNFAPEIGTMEKIPPTHVKRRIRRLRPQTALHWDDISMYYNSFQELDLYCDVFFYCKNNVRIGAHQFIVSPYSRILRGFFRRCCGHPTQASFVLPDVSAEELQKLLELLYTGVSFVGTKDTIKKFDALCKILEIEIPVDKVLVDSAFQTPLSEWPPSHPSDEKAPFQCQICDKQFEVQEARDRHEDKHRRLQEEEEVEDLSFGQEEGEIPLDYQSDDSVVEMRPGDNLFKAEETLTPAPQQITREDQPIPNVEKEPSGRFNELTSAADRPSSINDVLKDLSDLKTENSDALEQPQNPVENIPPTGTLEDPPSGQMPSEEVKKPRAKADKHEKEVDELMENKPQATEAADFTNETIEMDSNIFPEKESVVEEPNGSEMQSHEQSATKISEELLEKKPEIEETNVLEPLCHASKTFTMDVAELITEQNGNEVSKNVSRRKTPPKKTEQPLRDLSQITENVMLEKSKNLLCFMCDKLFHSASKLKDHLYVHFVKEIFEKFSIMDDASCPYCRYSPKPSKSKAAASIVAKHVAVSHCGLKVLFPPSVGEVLFPKKPKPGYDDVSEIFSQESDGGLNDTVRDRSLEYYNGNESAMVTDEIQTEDEFVVTSGHKVTKEEREEPGFAIGRKDPEEEREEKEEFDFPNGHKVPDEEGEVFGYTDVDDEKDTADDQMFGDEMEDMEENIPEPLVPLGDLRVTKIPSQRRKRKNEESPSVTFPKSRTRRDKREQMQRRSPVPDSLSYPETFQEPGTSPEPETCLEPEPTHEPEPGPILEPEPELIQEPYPEPIQEPEPELKRRRYPTRGSDTSRERDQSTESVRSTLSTDIQKTHQNVCYRCGSQESDSAALKRHLSIVHLATDLTFSFGKCFKKSLKCMICKKATRSKEDMLEHMGVDHKKIRGFLPEEIGAQLF